jgi:hypothetical protein
MDKQELLNNFLNAATQKEPVKIADLFNELMLDKAQGLVQNYRDEVARNVFKPQEPQGENT